MRKRREPTVSAGRQAVPAGRQVKSPASVGDILSKMYNNNKFAKKLKQYSVFDVWEEIVGETIARQTKPLKMRGDTLVVETKSSAWVQELSFMKPLILKKIGQHIPDAGIADLKFTVGRP